ncbi:hypothetical protein [Nonomuraea cavernae]|uniref:Uncharacterized protein n=1 Tax=Nonomuraea cavernae TaxID=2045107 RepID=A0A918DM76_9ACTN|nr:hypothetical protein [Nonomuraea cavernae]MCA2187022.1 hypothetical protein [Nonomuraea cavernae]GGO74988.1 hypothetical protein GCM10012289_48960 [Nonomuraea cavernae]
MAADDHRQVTTELLRTRDFLAAVSNPIAIITEVVFRIHALTAILREVPGDPDGIDALGAGFQQMRTALASADADLHKVSTRVPSVWKGDAAREAVAALKATHHLVQRSAHAMRRANVLLQDYADEVRRLKGDLEQHRQRLIEAVRELDGVRDLTRNLLNAVRMLDGDGGIVDVIARAISAIDGAIAVFEQLDAASSALQRGLRDIQGRARASVVRSRHVDAFDSVLLAAAGDDRLVKGDDGTLSTAQLARAADRMDALSDADRARLLHLLDQAASETERAYLMKALAAGHSVDDISTFAGLIRGKSEGWLGDMLSPIDPRAAGAAVNGVDVKQQNQQTCGSTVIMAARIMNDPLYALSLTADDQGHLLPPADLRARLHTEQNRIHDSTNTLWPQALGTTPWGLANGLNDHAGSFGVTYDWRLVADTSPGSVTSALNDAVGAVDAGHTVPVLIGDSHPRHYVLLIEHEDDELVFYNPAGRITRVKEDDFLNGDLSAVGYEHVQGVIVPR